MPRTLWFAAGAGVGVYAMVRARRLAEAFTPDGLRDRAGAAVVGLRAFRDEVAQGQADKETELRERLHLVPSGLKEIASPKHRRPVTSTGSAHRSTSSTDDEEGTA
jgi:hypothetical protein